MINTALIEKYKDTEDITYESLASLLKITRMTLSNILNKRTCNLETFIAIADLLNVSTDELLERDVNNILQKEDDEGNKEDKIYEEPSFPSGLSENEKEVYITKKFEVEKADVKMLIETVISQQRTIEYLVKK